MKWLSLKHGLLLYTYLSSCSAIGWMTTTGNAGRRLGQSWSGKAGRRLWIGWSGKLSQLSKTIVYYFFCHRCNDRQRIFSCRSLSVLVSYLLFWWIYFTFCFFCKAHFQLFYALIKKCVEKDALPFFFFFSKGIIHSKNHLLALMLSWTCVTFSAVKCKTSTCF